MHIFMHRTFSSIPSTICASCVTLMVSSTGRPKWHHIARPKQWAIRPALPGQILLEVTQEIRPQHYWKASLPPLKKIILVIYIFDL